MSTASQPLERECELKGDLRLPRIIVGLWQVSSEGWNARQPLASMINDLRTYYINGYFAFDMADIYGPAEPIYGDFLESLKKSPPTSLLSDTIPEPIGLTKWVPSSRESTTPSHIESVLQKSISRMKTSMIDVLQFHWWDYSEKRYLEAVQHLAQCVKQEKYVRHVGLTNVDAIRLEEMCRLVPAIVTNQVQYSVIDTRPEGPIRRVCEKYSVKLLTYGTLLGGLLSETWMDQPEPMSNLTTSQCKYLQTIHAWGDWTLFQKMLKTLETIAHSHNCSIANIAIRYVLQQPHVASVIVGARLGVSSHVEENWKSLDVVILPEEMQRINEVQAMGKNLLDVIGDCGQEYRQ
ncbi:hypothetical protein BZG36_04071 [Bifiguratus adelaidae]|uniref:NADP-dependent oxidoreductase domain-containing protein n=1 Tax=Bifiguratus adelaidae TaxID=1938954 RepID=A0A261XXS4_9FUNG|nr:hypothetical protein BZG36_04071 [Bifiguratus adelaidae]